MGSTGASVSATVPANLPVLNGKNWNRWSVQIKAIMGFQEVLDIVEADFPAIDATSSEEARATHKENKKKDFKAICILHQCVDDAHFEKISSAKSAHQAWKILETCNEGA